MNEEVKSLSTRYEALHRRMQRRFGTPQYCMHCMCFGEGPTYEWAQIHNAPLIASFEGFIRLCKKCHTSYDGGIWNKQKEKDPYKALERAYAGPGKKLDSIWGRKNSKIGIYKPSAETKIRMSEAAKRRWANDKS